MKRFMSVIAAVLATLVVLSGCSQDGAVLVTWQAGKDKGNIKIGDVKKDILGQIMYQPQLASDLAWNKQTLLDRYVSMELNLQDQLDKGFTNQPGFQDNLKGQYLRQYYIGLNSKAQEKFYKALNNSPVELVKASHILIMVNEYTNIAGTNAKLPADKLQAISAEKEKIALNILESLKASKNLDKDFSNAAALNSDDKGNAGRGGDLGWYTRGQMVPEFEKASFESTSKGLVKNLIKTQYGYHILFITEPVKKTSIKGVESLVGKQQFSRMQGQLQNSVYLSERAKWLTDIVTYDATAKTLKVGAVTYDSNTIASLPDTAEVAKIGKTVYKWKEVREVISIFVPGFTNGLTVESVNMQINNFKNFWFFVQQSLDAGVQNTAAFKAETEKQKKEAMKQIANQNLEKELSAKAKATLEPKAVLEQYNKNRANYKKRDNVQGKAVETQMTFEQAKSQIEDELSRSAMMSFYNTWKQEAMKTYKVEVNEGAVKTLMAIEKNEIEVQNKKKAEQMKKQQEAQKKQQQGIKQVPQLPNK